MKLVKMLAFSVALVLVVSELGQLTVAEKGSKKRTTKRTAPKVKRTISVKATEPAPEEAQAQEAPAEKLEKNVGLHNMGPTNTIDMQPSISIGSPMPQAPIAQREVVEAPLPQQQPPQAPAPQPQPQVQAVAPNPIQVEQEPIIQSGGSVKTNAMPILSNVEQQTMLNQANNQLLTSIMDSNNLQSKGLVNSNNLLMEQSVGNNNAKQTVLKNSGNTESVHIDGVGNNKITHITNANNNEHHSVANEAPQQPQPTGGMAIGRPMSNHLVSPVGAGMPALIQINVNSEPLGQAKMPILVLPDGSQWPAVGPKVFGYLAGYQMAPQASASLNASGLPAAPQPPVWPPSGQAPTPVMAPQQAPVFLPPAPGPVPVFFPAPPPVPMLHPLPVLHPASMLHPLPVPLHPGFHQQPPHGKLEKAVKRAKKSIKKLDKKMSKLEKRQKRTEQSNKREKLPEPAANPPPSTETKLETQPAEQQEEQPPKVVAAHAEDQRAEEEETTGEDGADSGPQSETQESPEPQAAEGREDEEPEGGYEMRLIRVPVAQPEKGGAPETAGHYYSRIHGLNRMAEVATDAAGPV